MDKKVKVIVEVVLLFAIVGLTYAIVRSIMKPVEFNKQVAFRSELAIQRLKDIRTLQVAYKSETGKFLSTVDSLKDFYNNGKISVVMQIGSLDDSLAVVHTERIKKKNRKITPQQMYQMYLDGDNLLIFSIENKIAVKDTLFKDRSDFCVDSLAFIPYSGGDSVILAAVTRQVSGVQVPLFEAKMPYKLLLKGLDNQLRINLDHEKMDQNRYVGLQVGSIDAPNNNAGNWE